MFYSTQRDQLRQKYYDAFQKAMAKQPLDPVEQMIVHSIEMHPEYIAIFEKPAKFLDKDYTVELGETNPFLHLSSHIGLYEQLSTDRPKGIRKIFQQLVEKKGMDAHEVEHQMIEVMMEMLWQSQRDNQLPDDKLYLKKLKKLTKV
jgi:hypothetical protein